jgi:phosphate transport system substrate-binding protein
MPATHTKEYPMFRKLTLTLAALTLAGCAGSDVESVSLTGAGATFPYPVYSKWFNTFYAATGHQINYQSVGSGAGVKQYSEGTVDFGATDGPMTDEEIAGLTGGVIHVPTVLGAVVLTWNLPSLGTTKLKLDGATIADIFLGKITKWNDPRLVALNPGVTLPDQDLLVVHRSDGSGTSFIFTDYLAKVSPEWQSTVGVGKSINWPTGLGGKGNEGVTQQVKQVEGTLGYVELIYAVENNLPFADVQNVAGEFVTPSMESVTAAAGGVELPADTDFRVSITNAPGTGAYPISSFTWLLVRPQHEDAAKGAAIKQFLTWMIGDQAQAEAAVLHYAPLPASVRALVEQKIATL